MRDSIREIVRRKQKCRHFVYLLLILGFVGYGAIQTWGNGADSTSTSYRSRHILVYNNDTENSTPDTTTSSSPSSPSNLNSTSNESACAVPSIAEFPRDFFTQTQRQQGAVLVHVLVGSYMCIALGIVSDYYFVPSLDVLCYKLQIQADVAGASLMAIGSSAPELCASIIGVFVTKGDIGIGTILGSAVFNLLFVIGICGLFATTDLRLTYWPITRDTVAYGVTIVALGVVIFDTKVVAVEAVVMLVLYVLYLVFMAQNQRIEKAFYLFTGDTKSYNLRFQHSSKDETTPLTPNDVIEDVEDDCKEITDKKEVDDFEGSEKAISCDSDEDGYGDGWPDEPPENIIECPEPLLEKIAWVLIFPIKLIFFLTVPDLRRPCFRGFVFLTFFMSIGWIGFLTYTLVWMVTVVGFTIDIPDSVMGLTFVTFGSSVPDALASIIVAKQGKGDMAVSQALGSNVFDILLGLGLPWTIKSFMKDSGITIQSIGMLISCFVTFVLNILVLLVLYVKRFSLGRRIGIGLLLAYVIYLGASVSIELLLYNGYRLPMCKLHTRL